MTLGSGVVHIYTNKRIDRTSRYTHIYKYLYIYVSAYTFVYMYMQIRGPSEFGQWG